jgi:hypothetical protein
MKGIRWLFDGLLNRESALSLYKQGMAKAKKHDHLGAIDDYTKSIDAPNTPDDVIAMVLYNRALVYAATGEDRKGVNDLDAVLAMNDAPVNVKTMARQKLARIESRVRKSDA